MITTFKKYRFILIAALIAAIIIAGALWRTNSNNAYGILGFGGSITNVFWCTCSGGILLTIGPPGPVGTYVFQAGVSRLYAYGQIFRAGPQTLGTYVPFGTCLYVSGPTCNSQTVTGGTILTIGTSAL